MFTVSWDLVTSWDNIAKWCTSWFMSFISQIVHLRHLSSHELLKLASVCVLQRLSRQTSTLKLKCHILEERWFGLQFVSPVVFIYHWRYFHPVINRFIKFNGGGQINWPVCKEHQPIYTFSSLHQSCDPSLCRSIRRARPLMSSSEAPQRISKTEKGAIPQSVKASPCAFLSPSYIITFSSAAQQHAV